MDILNDWMAINENKIVGAYVHWNICIKHWSRS